MTEEYKQFLEEGKRTEKFVMQVTSKKFGGKVFRATKKEDMLAHVDFWWDMRGRGVVGVDVKGLHKENRSDEDYNEDYFWLEYRNVKGEYGWLFGKSAYIAFLLKSKILYVPTMRLRDFVLGIVKANAPHDGKRPYTLKTREGRKDVIVKVERSCIEYFSEFYIDLEKPYYK